MPRCNKFINFVAEKERNRNQETDNESKMSHIIHFYKMEGAGNDYVYVNTQEFPIAHPEAVSIALSRYHFGIGSDGLILVGKPTDPEKADFSMRIFNNDGSEALMCGNGIRCTAKLIHDQGWSDRNPLRVESLSGIKVIDLRLAPDGTVEEATVDMEEPHLEVPALFTSDTTIIEKTAREAGLGALLQSGDLELGRFVSMGNPHFVFFVKDIKQIDLPKVGPLLEHCPAFPERCNVEFAQLVGKDHIRARVWERGSGITLACGTGACATAVASALLGKTSERVQIDMDGGTLHIQWKRDQDNHVMLTGPARMSFQGEVDIEDCEL